MLFFPASRIHFLCRINSRHRAVGVRDFARHCSHRILSESRADVGIYRAHSAGKGSFLACHAEEGQGICLTGHDPRIG